MNARSEYLMGLVGMVRPTGPEAGSGVCDRCTKFDKRDVGQQKMETGKSWGGLPVGWM